mmetsp:Transcript_39435/g.80680  ORF Transcript_39435/g.80680 Transcript_39435/m.80680 type:complete len:83 (+) Transcript_39435:136-384(+)
MLELFRQDLFRPADAFQQPDNPHFTNAELSPKRLCMRNTWDFHLSAGGSWPSAGSTRGIRKGRRSKAMQMRPAKASSSRLSS